MHAPAADSTLASPASRLRRLVAVIGGVSAALGLLVIFGWHLRLIALLQLRPGLAPMQYNTALCFVLAGLALDAWGRLPRAVPMLGGLVAAMGSLTLAEYLFHTNLGVDQLLFRSYMVAGASSAGRMSPVSAFCFALAGITLVCLGWAAAWRWRPLVAGSCASVIMSIALAALLGYAFRLPGTYGWGQMTRVAAHTSAGLTLVGAGLFIIAWSISLRPGESTPRWLPVPLAFAVFTGSLVLYFALESKQDQEIAQTVRAAAEGARDQIVARMDARFRSLTRMAREWEISGPPTQAAWDDDAAGYVRDVPDMQALEWLDNSRTARWIVPLAGNEAKLNLNLTLEPRRNTAIEQAAREHQAVMTRPVTLFRGGLGFVVYVPIVVNGKPGGFLAAVFNAQSCLDRYLPPSVATGEAIRILESGTPIYQRDADGPPPNETLMVKESAEMHGATWDLRMWPTPALVARLGSTLPAFVLCAGVLGALLLGAVCYYAQRAARHATETARANAALQAALDKVRTLEGLLPICSTCKRVRDDTGYWSQIDSYLHEHTNASLSHGYCPECAAKAFQDLGYDVPDSVQAAVAAGNFE